jgi:glutathione S-transferase
LPSLTSPYVRKVRIVLAEKKIDCDLVLDSPWVEGNQVTASNPLGKIPVLVLDDESTLYDSRVIAEYLDTVAPNNRLLPASGRETHQRQALGGAGRRRSRCRRRSLPRGQAPRWGAQSVVDRTTTRQGQSGLESHVR